MLYAARFFCCAMVSTWTSIALAQGKNDIVVGTWSLKSVTNGTNLYPYGPHGRGMLVFTKDGHFVEIIVNGDLPKVATNNRLTATAAENKAIVSGTFGLFGTYTLSENQITFNVDLSTFPNFNGTKQVRNIEILNQDELKYFGAAGTAGLRAEADWIRIK